jgi:hypothetical protein
VQERNRAQQAVDEAREALAGAKKKKEKAAAQAALTAAEERLSAGEPNGCLNESPCSPLTRHGASIKKPFGAARALAAKEMGEAEEAEAVAHRERAEATAAAEAAHKERQEAEAAAAAADKALQTANQAGPLSPPSPFKA